jgi:hypothetical protein
LKVEPILKYRKRCKHQCFTSGMIRHLLPCTAVPGLSLLIAVPCPHQKELQQVSRFASSAWRSAFYLEVLHAQVQRRWGTMVM